MRRGHPCSGLSKIATRRRPTRHWFLANTKWCFFPFAHTSYPTSRSLTYSTNSTSKGYSPRATDIADARCRRAGGCWKSGLGKGANAFF